jgi:CubicO group peptidase (beta-lactamase class C family)
MAPLQHAANHPKAVIRPFQPASLAGKTLLLAAGLTLSVLGSGLAQGAAATPKTLDHLDADIGGKGGGSSPGPGTETKSDRLGPAVPKVPRVWPGKDWPVATPEGQGMSSNGLAEVEAYAQKYGGRSGCVIRHGYLVKEWGPVTNLTEIKSATKGMAGATLLGLASDAGLVKLDDAAQKYYANIGSELPQNVATGWLPEITVRQLATMTAGFDDSRPAKLVRRPGTGGEYSNDTANMEAELLTLVFHEDLYPLFKRKVMDPIGVADSEWRWRENGYRAKTIAGLKTREFASGIAITHRAMARVGYLYLNDGNWNGRQILSKEYIHEATQPALLPAPYPYYAFHWGSNAKGILPDLPRDMYWALGLGDTVLIVCPSADIVAVRMGTGNTKSILPPFTSDWELKTGGFFKVVLQALRKEDSVAE